MVMLVQMPDSYRPERSYIASILLGEFLELNYQLKFESRHNIRITCEDSKELLITDKLFSIPENIWLKPESLPEQPLKTWTINNTQLSAVTVDRNIPVIYGNDPSLGSFYECTENRTRLGLDIFGSSFFMLTRYEEIIKPQRDEHDRFPAAASIAFQEGFLKRPIVNEYLELLWSMMKRLWPHLRCKEHSFRIRTTHDIDLPFIYHHNKPIKWMKLIGRELIKNNNPDFAWKHFVNGGLKMIGLPSNDPMDTFDWLMDISETIGCTSAFYFMTKRQNGEGYLPDDADIKKLARHIARRGHEIGFHPHLGTHANANELKSQADMLRHLLKSEQINQKDIGGRQHYLCWRAPVTWQLWEDCGLAYDSTLGYADHIGFRAGTCYDYSVYNVTTRRKLKLKEYPLLIMDGTLLGKKYMNLNHIEALDIGLRLKEIVRQFGGSFNILWHNSWFYFNPDEKEFYKSLLTSRQPSTRLSHDDKVNGECDSRTTAKAI